MKFSRYEHRTLSKVELISFSILQVKAFDSDGSAPNNVLVYRIKSGASDKFVISPDSGVIYVAQGASLDPDLTTPKTTSYSLIVVSIRLLNNKYYFIRIFLQFMN